MSKKQHEAHKYILSASKGKDVGAHVKHACLRYLADLKKSKSNRNYPYYFDAGEAQRVLDFCGRMVHFQGRKAGEQLQLDAWQQSILWQMFGWRRKSDSRRRFTKAYIEVARKNGKTLLISCVAMYAWLCEREAGSQGYCIATKREQAKIAWENIKEQIRANKELQSALDIWQNSITLKDNKSVFFKPLSSEAKTEDGLNPHVVIVDEYHAHPNDSMLEIMESAYGGRSCPLTLIITTAGNNLYSPCFKERENAIRIAEQSVDNDEYLAIVYALDEHDDWADERNWIKANPGINTIHEAGFVSKRVQQALNEPHKTNGILTKNLNTWVEVDSRWIEQARWDEVADEYTWDDMAGRQCVVGMDLSAVRDITALAYCFFPIVDDHKYRFLWRYWLPVDDIVDRERKDKVPYKYWSEAGHITLASGGSINYSDILEAIQQDAEKFDIVEIAYDPYHSASLIPQLEEHFSVVPIQQSYRHMSPLTHELERGLLAHEFAHDANPVSRWMFSCMEIKRDRQDNIMPMKPQREKSSARIDGIVAAIMAYGRAVLGGERGSYEIGDIIAI